LISLSFRENEAAMIEKIATDVSNMLNNSTPTRDFEELVVPGAHMEKWNYFFLNV